MTGALRTTSSLAFQARAALVVIRIARFLIGDVGSGHDTAMNYSETCLGSEGVEGVLRHPRGKAAARKKRQRLDRLTEQEWAELPYIMMRITTAIRTQNGKRFYWRDQSVQCGEIELNLNRSDSEDGTFVYTAIYSREDDSRKDSRHDFLVPLQPLLEDHQLRWAAPALCGTTKLTAEELAQVLVAQLGILKTTEFL